MELDKDGIHLFYLFKLPNLTALLQEIEEIEIF